MRLHVGRLLYYSSDSCTLLGVGRLTVGLNQRRIILDERQLYQTHVRLNVGDLEHTYTYARAVEQKGYGHV